MKTKVQVKDLQIGDQLSSGAKIVSDPFESLHARKGKVIVGVLYSNGKLTTQEWGKSTTVTVINR